MNIQEVPQSNENHRRDSLAVKLCKSVVAATDSQLFAGT